MKFPKKTLPGQTIQLNRPIQLSKQTILIVSATQEVSNNNHIKVKTLNEHTKGRKKSFTGFLCDRKMAGYMIQKRNKSM